MHLSSSDIKDFDRFNKVYSEVFTGIRPARTTVQSVLWGGIKVEIDCVARVNETLRIPGSCLGRLSVASGQEAVLAVKGLPAPISLAVDAQGALFAGTGDGRILRIVGRNTIELLAQTGGIPVSMAFDAKDDLYVADARRRRSSKSLLGARLGRNQRAALPPGVRDERGNLYTVENGKVVVRSSRGAIVTVYELPAGRASAVALGGLDLKTLFVADTSAGRSSG